MASHLTATMLSGAGGTPLKQRVLLTGGAGYIGSHTAVELLEAGATVVVVDNLVNSCEESLDRVRKITGCADDQLIFHNIDLCDKDKLESCFANYGQGGFDACIHFAGLKAVGESVQKPLSYYQNNIVATLNLLELSKQYGCRRIVFSSSATVYGDPSELPLTENALLRATNPYGRTKLFIEDILRDVHISDPAFWRIAILRYFNPIGAHPSGTIGEDPVGIPNNLMPYIAQVCVGKRPHLSVFGNDYDTPDGTGVRDYIHVVDLARGHVAALRKMVDADAWGALPGEGCEAINLGTGTGVSVLELVEGMRAASGHPVPIVIGDRRAGDIGTCYATADKALNMLEWRATHTTAEGCASSWKWQSGNPSGYN